MENNCNIVKDIIPLYAEGIACDDSAQLVESHVSSCADCSALLEKIKSDSSDAPKIPDSAAPLRLVKAALRYRRIRIAALCALCVFLVFTMIFSASVTRRYIPYSADVISVEELADGALHISLPEDATGYEIDYTSNYDTDAISISPADVTGYEIDRTSGNDTSEKVDTIQISVWRSEFGKLMGSSTTDIYIPASKGISYVDYCDFANDGELIRVFGESSYAGAMVLERLVLGYYTILAVLGLIIFGLLWLILRRKRAGKVMKYLFFLPASYLLGHFMIMGKDMLTYTAAENFGFILTAFAAVYAIIVIVLRWREDARGE